MLILDETLSDVHRDRDFGQVEARVTFVAKIEAGQPVRRFSVLTHVPARGTAPLRDRLMQDARRLAHHLPRRTPTVPSAATA